MNAFTLRRAQDLIQASPSFSPGAFWLHLLRLVLGCTWPVAIASGETILPGETRVAALSTAGQEDVWTFEAEAGDQVTFRLVRISGDFGPYMHFYGPDGENLAASTSVGAQVTRVFEAPQKGTYSVVIRDGSLSGVRVGEYLILHTGYPPALYERLSAVSGLPNPTPLDLPPIPDRPPDKDHLVVITHGWQMPAGSTVDVSWVYEMTALIATQIEPEVRSRWHTLPWIWTVQATTMLPDNALLSAFDQGVHLGRGLGAQGWAHVHLIGKSAGAALIFAASQEIANAFPNTADILAIIRRGFLRFRPSCSPAIRGFPTLFGESHLTRATFPVTLDAFGRLGG